jgi:hypothetical protein
MLFAFMIIVFLLLLLLDIAAMRWGADSRDAANSSEWARHQEFWI